MSERGPIIWTLDNWALGPRTSTGRTPNISNQPVGGPWSVVFVRSLNLLPHIVTLRVQVLKHIRYVPQTIIPIPNTETLPTNPKIVLWTLRVMVLRVRILLPPTLGPAMHLQPLRTSSQDNGDLCVSASSYIHEMKLGICQIYP